MTALGLSGNLMWVKDPLWRVSAAGRSGQSLVAASMPSTTRCFEYRVVSVANGRQRAPLSRGKRTDW
jgi:hypothetical protein